MRDGVGALGQYLLKFATAPYVKRLGSFSKPVANPIATFIRSRAATVSHSHLKGHRLPPERPLLDTPDPRFRILITDDGSRSLQDTVLNESYHSGSGAAAEPMSFICAIAISSIFFPLPKQLASWNMDSEQA